MGDLTRRRVRIVAVLWLGVCGTLLSGCSGDPTPSGTTTTSTVTTVPSTSRTAGRGAVLPLGKRVVVRWHDSLMTVAVTKVSRGKIKDLLRLFPLNDAARSSSVYYVSAAVRNTGKGDLSGRHLTLYGQVSKDLVVPPVDFHFSTFDRCDNPPLPKSFTAGAKAHLCLVMLAPDHGRFSAIQWRGPPRSEPISWRVR